MTAAEDRRWMAAALALSTRTRGRTAPNPNVGCIIVQGGVVVGRGWTQPGGRPHAEEVALAQAGEKSRGATCYVTLEPCAHRRPGGACSAKLVAAGVARVVFGLRDPDPRTDGQGAKVLAARGVAVDGGQLATEVAAELAGFLLQRRQGRPLVTLKLATSLDGCIALADGSSRWITGASARRHAHGERARHEAIVVGRGTVAVDAPALDVRVEGLEERAPRRFLLSRSGAAPEGWEVLRAPEDVAALDGVDHVLVEGGAGAAAAFLRAKLVDRLVLYRAPIVIGGGRASIAGIGLHDLADAHGWWRLNDARMLGSDRLEVYARATAASGEASAGSPLERSDA